MSLKEHKLPGGFNFVKLADFPDKEKMIITGAGIATGGKYGDQAYLITDDGTHVTLPARYVDYVRELLLDDDALKELSQGVPIMKDSYEYDTGKITATFSWV